MFTYFSLIKDFFPALGAGMLRFESFTGWKFGRHGVRVAITIRITTLAICVPGIQIHAFGRERQFVIRHGAAYQES